MGRLGEQWHGKMGNVLTESMVYPAKKTWDANDALPSRPPGRAARLSATFTACMRCFVCWLHEIWEFVPVMRSIRHRIL